MKENRNWIVYDVETGGLSSDKNPIVEVACIAIDADLNKIDEFESLVQQYGGLAIEDSALRANGLSRQEIASGILVEQAVKELVLFFKGKCVGKKKPILVGHNIERFDNLFLEKMFALCKEDLYKYVETHCEDTMWHSRNKHGNIDVDRHNLHAACQRAGIDIVDAHRAMADVKATAELWVSYVKCLRSSGTQTDEVKSRSRFRF